MFEFRASAFFPPGSNDKQHRSVKFHGFSFFIVGAVNTSGNSARSNFNVVQCSPVFSVCQSLADGMHAVPNLNNTASPAKLHTWEVARRVQSAVIHHEPS